MNTYAHHTLSLRKEISEIARQSLSLIGKLDKKILILSQRLDVKLKVSVDEQSPDDVEELSLLKKAIEAVSLRKVQLAMKCYDFIDQNIKLMDMEMGTLESKIRATLPQDNAESSSLRKRKYGSSSSFKEVQQTVSEETPSYCVCRCSLITDGMITCDNEEDCPTQFFHHECVGLLKKPRNSWLCPTCSNAKRCG